MGREGDHGPLAWETRCFPVPQVGRATNSLHRVTEFTALEKGWGISHPCVTEGETESHGAAAGC